MTGHIPPCEVEAVLDEAADEAEDDDPEGIETTSEAVLDEPEADRMC